MGVRQVLASSFADPADIAAFRRCKSKGNSDNYCFKFGDNGIGFWGEDTSQGSGASCALPPERIIETWGTLKRAARTHVLTTAMKTKAAMLNLHPDTVQQLSARGKAKPVLVTVGSKQTVCLVKDTMPHLAHITNGCELDLNPDAAAALGLKPPFKVAAQWEPLNQSKPRTRTKR